MDYKQLSKATRNFQKLALKSSQFNNSTIADALVSAKLVKYADDSMQEPTLVNPYYNLLMGINKQFIKMVEEYNRLVKQPYSNAVERQINQLDAKIKSMLGDYGVAVIATSKGNVQVEIGNIRYISRNPKLNLAFSGLSKKIQAIVSQYIRSQNFAVNSKAVLNLMPRFSLDW